MLSIGKMNVQEREANMDLVRVLSMIGVVGLHVIGPIRKANGMIGTEVLFRLLETIFMCSVNVFGILTGYLHVGRKIKSKSILIIWIEVFLLCMIISSISILLNGRKMGIFTLISYIFPFTAQRLWYLSCYSLLFFLIPYINLFFSNIEKNKVISLVAILFFSISLLYTGMINHEIFFVVNEGYSVVWLTFLYLLGGLLRKYFQNPKNGYYHLATFAIMIILTCIISYLIESVGNTPIKSLSPFFVRAYSSPLILVASISIVQFFRSFEIANKYIRHILMILSTHTFGVYIIHAHPFSLDCLLTSDNLNFLINENPVYSLCALLIFMVLVYVFCSVIYMIVKRLLLFSLIKQFITAVGIAIDSKIYTGGSRNEIL